MFLNWSLGLNIDFGFTGPVDRRILMLIYSFGYFMVNLIMGLLYKHAYNHHELLELNNRIHVLEKRLYDHKISPSNY